jgi:hypothetical protein
LVFVAQKVGFTYIRLTLADGQRVWEQASRCEPSHAVRHELQDGRFGILELKAPTCELGYADQASTCPRPPECKMPFCPCVSDERVFGIISDLLVEAWVKAAMKWNNGEQTPLRFDARVSPPKNQWQRGFSRSYAPARTSATERKPINPPLKDVVG